MAAALRAFFGYFFLLFIVRIAGRRPGKQLTPFEFVLVFFMGGLALTAMVGQELSFTNALCQIIAIAVAHYIVAFCRFKFPKFAHLTNGTPLVLLEKQCWHTETLKRMGEQQEDVMASARETVSLLSKRSTSLFLSVMAKSMFCSSNRMHKILRPCRA